MKMVKADLHIHTCLSPCADIDMSPKNIPIEAEKKGISLIAICDHNASENVPGVRNSALKRNINVLGGMEITTREEVHIVALFDNPDDLAAMQEVVYRHLPGQNIEDKFGDQIIADENDVVIGFNTRLLIGATSLTVEEVVDTVHRFNGLAIASHIDREGFGIIGQLGFIPPGLALDAVEVSAKGNPGQYSHLPFTVVTASDAHYLTDIGKATVNFYIRDNTFPEIKQAIHGQSGRRILL